MYYVRPLLPPTYYLGCIGTFGIMSALNINVDDFTAVQFRVICFLLCILYAFVYYFYKKGKVNIVPIS